METPQIQTQTPQCQKPRVLRIDLDPLYELAGAVLTSPTSMLNKILYEYDLHLAPAVVIEKQPATGAIYVVDLMGAQKRLGDNPGEEEVVSVLKEVCSEIIIVLSTGHGVVYACW